MCSAERGQSASNDGGLLRCEPTKRLPPGQAAFYGRGQLQLEPRYRAASDALQSSYALQARPFGVDDANTP